MQKFNLGEGWDVHVGEMLQGDWDVIIKNFNDASIYQTWAYAQVRWGCNSYEHVVVKNKNKIVAATQVILKKIPFIKCGIAYIPWGPLWQIDDNKYNFVALNKTILFLKQYYADKLGLLLRVDPPIFECNTDALKIFKETGFNLNRTFPKYRTIILNLTLDLEFIRKNLRQKWRNMLNQAERNEIQIRQGFKNSDFDIFLEMQTEMLLRKKFVPGVDYNEFKKVHSALSIDQKFNILVSFTENRPNACLIISKIGKKGIYLLGASTVDGRNLRSSYLLQWEAIKYLKSQNCTSYDLGGIDPIDNPGVFNFKSGLGGNDKTHLGFLEICTNQLSSLSIQYAEIGKAKFRSLKNRANSFLKFNK